MAVVVRRRAPGAPALARARLIAWGRAMLDALGLEGAELGVLLCDDPAIQRLNRRHRGLDRSTDVLAFPMDGSRHALVRARRRLARAEPVLLGDVVIALPTAARQARSRRRPLESEVRFLLAHGLLHLVGFDHATPAEKREMTRATGRLVAAATRAERARRHLA